MVVLKRRTRPYLSNHYKYSINQDAEKYYYALLLLFKPWQNSERVMGSSKSYQTELEYCKEPDAVK